jgi:hypothetical protein
MLLNEVIIRYSFTQINVPWTQIQAAKSHALIQNSRSRSSEQPNARDSCYQPKERNRENN